MVSFALGASLITEILIGSWIDTMVRAWVRSHWTYLLSLRLGTGRWVDTVVCVALGASLISDLSLVAGLIPWSQHGSASHWAHFSSLRLVTGCGVDAMVPARVRFVLGAPLIIETCHW